MALEDLVRRDVATPLGVVRTWSTPAAADALRPVVFAIPSMLASVEDFAALGQGFGLLADICILRLPIDAASQLSDYALPALSAMVGGLIEQLFPARPVVLFGMSSGALVALGVRAANVARVIAAEPPLATGDLWPIATSMREHLERIRDPAASAFAFATLGLDETRSERRNHLGVFDGLHAPVEVLLGEAPLQPPRELKRFPSLVGASERAALAARPWVRLHVLPGTGHNVLGQAFRPVREIVLEGCRRAASMPGPERLRVDEPLLEATPLAARRVLYCGPGGEAFAAAFAALNPKADLTLAPSGSSADLPPAPDELFDAVVLAGPPEPDLLAALARRLRDGGHLIARWVIAADALKATLAPLGLALREPIDAGGTGIVRAQMVGAGGAPRPALHVMSIAYSALLMDIRTRLPTQGLRSDPELQVTYGVAPFDLPGLPVDKPKILVMQRPAEMRMEAWRPFMANAIRGGWVVVMEYDDYPPLIAEVQGRSSSEIDMHRFRYVHAVQTTTPPLLEAFRAHNPATMAFPNSAFSLAPFPASPRPPRVFYGGVLRGRYPVEVARSLGGAVAEHPQAEFIVIGDREVFDALPTTSKRYYGYMAFEAYLDLMSQCSISLSPIEALPMRETKSDAKFIDASRAGVLTIASPTIYDRVIEHGVNGLLAPDVADWSPLLARALRDDVWRQAMARRAWEYVRDERMFADQVAVRRDWYLDLWSRRAELNEALMGRIAGLREAVYG